MQELSILLTLTQTLPSRPGAGMQKGELAHQRASAPALDTAAAAPAKHNGTQSEGGGEAGNQITAVGETGNDNEERQATNSLTGVLPPRAESDGSSGRLEPLQVPRAEKTGDGGLCGGEGGAGDGGAGKRRLCIFWRRDGERAKRNRWTQPSDKGEEKKEERTTKEEERRKKDAREGQTNTRHDVDGEAWSDAEEGRCSLGANDSAAVDEGVGSISAAGDDAEHGGKSAGPHDAAVQVAAQAIATAASEGVRGGRKRNSSDAEGARTRNSHATKGVMIPTSVRRRIQREGGTVAEGPSAHAASTVSASESAADMGQPVRLTAEALGLSESAGKSSRGGEPNAAAAYMLERFFRSSEAERSAFFPVERGREVAGGGAASEATAARMSAMAVEAAARPSAVAVEAAARPSAMAVEAAARPSAIAVEAAARPSAVAVPQAATHPAPKDAVEPGSNAGADAMQRDKAAAPSPGAITKALSGIHARTEPVGAGMGAREQGAEAGGGSKEQGAEAGERHSHLDKARDWSLLQGAELRAALLDRLDAAAGVVLCIFLCLVVHLS